MVKLWFKLLCGDKIVGQTEYESDEAFDYSEFRSYIESGCYKLDVATPVIIKQHLFAFAKYNCVTFKQADFVESINFDKLYIENLDR